MIYIYYYIYILFAIAQIKSTQIWQYYAW